MVTLVGLCSLCVYVCVRAYWSVLWRGRGRMWTLVSVSVSESCTELLLRRFIWFTCSAGGNRRHVPSSSAPSAIPLPEMMAKKRAWDKGHFHQQKFVWDQMTKARRKSARQIWSCCIDATWWTIPLLMKRTDLCINICLLSSSQPVTAFTGALGCSFQMRISLIVLVRKWPVFIKVKLHLKMKYFLIFFFLNSRIHGSHLMHLVIIHVRHKCWSFLE